MITEPTLMPDFRDNLEQALYRRAVASAPAQAMPRVVLRMPRLALARQLALGGAALAVVLAVILTTITGRSPSHQAFAEPLVLNQLLSPVPAGVRPGYGAKAILGPDARYEGVIAIPSGGATAYAIKSQRGWCLTAQTGGLVGGSPSAVTCATTQQLKRVGMYATTQGGRLVAIVPPTAPPPTVTEASGTAHNVYASRLGVVEVSGMHVGDRVTLNAISGTSLTATIN